MQRTSQAHDAKHPVAVCFPVVTSLSPVQYSSPCPTLLEERLPGCRGRHSLNCKENTASPASEPRAARKKSPMARLAASLARLWGCRWSKTRFLGRKKGQGDRVGGTFMRTRRVSDTQPGTIKKGAHTTRATSSAVPGSGLTPFDTTEAGWVLIEDTKGLGIVNSWGSGLIVTALMGKKSGTEQTETRRDVHWSSEPCSDFLWSSLASACYQR